MSMANALSRFINPNPSEIKQSGLASLLLNVLRIMVGLVILFFIGLAPERREGRHAKANGPT